MQHKTRFSLSLAALLLLVATQLPAQTPQPFSADFVSTTVNGEKYAGKWFFSPPKMRFDITSMPPGAANGPLSGPMSMIANASTQARYVLMPQLHMYMDARGNSQFTPPEFRYVLQQKGGNDPCISNPQNTCKKLGTETVNGRSCEKWEVTDKDSGKNYLWIDEKLHFPIKMQDGSGSVIELSNIQEGAPDPSLFTLPPDYKPFDPSALRRR